MLTKEQRIRLRSYAQKLPDLVQVGKEDIDDNLIKQINDNLSAYELIKVKVNNNSILSPVEIGEELEEICKCEIVTIIGSKVVLYKKSHKKTDKKLQPVRDIMSK